MKIVRTLSELRAEIEISQNKDSIGFVPTMGALHDGHISLIERCKSDNLICIASVFVNPTQFNDKKDLLNYPRTEESDCVLLAQAGCDIVFIPSYNEVYPNDDKREFTFGGLEDVMEGPSRPGHFNGVAQVVSRLFEYVTPNRAYFGEKDYQQLAIIRYMTNRLSLPIEIIGCTTKRSKDGLALSSRNMLLSCDEIKDAPYIYKVLQHSLEKVSQLTVSEMEKWVISEIEKCKSMKVEYYSICNGVNLQRANNWDEDGGTMGCITVKIGVVRLIDNIKYN